MENLAKIQCDLIPSNPGAELGLEIVIVVDNNNNQTLLTEDNAEKLISRNSQVITIVQLVYLSLSKTAVSTKWKLIQAKVYPDAKPITNVVIVDDDTIESLTGYESTEKNP